LAGIPWNFSGSDIPLLFFSTLCLFGKCLILFGTPIKTGSKNRKNSSRILMHYSAVAFPLAAGDFSPLAKEKQKTYLPQIKHYYARGGWSFEGSRRGWQVGGWAVGWMGGWVAGGRARSG